MMQTLVIWHFFSRKGRLAAYDKAKQKKEKRHKKIGNKKPHESKKPEKSTFFKALTNESKQKDSKSKTLSKTQKTGLGTIDKKNAEKQTRPSFDEQCIFFKSERSENDETTPLDSSIIQVKKSSEREEKGSAKISPKSSQVNPRKITAIESALKALSSTSDSKDKKGNKLAHGTTVSIQILVHVKFLKASFLYQGISAYFDIVMLILRSKGTDILRYAHQSSYKCRTFST